MTNLKPDDCENLKKHMDDLAGSLESVAKSLESFHQKMTLEVTLSESLIKPIPIKFDFDYTKVRESPGEGEGLNSSTQTGKSSVNQYESHEELPREIKEQLEVKIPQDITYQVEKGFKDSFKIKLDLNEFDKSLEKANGTLLEKLDKIQGQVEDSRKKIKDINDTQDKVIEYYSFQRIIFPTSMIMYGLAAIIFFVAPWLHEHYRNTVYTHTAAIIFSGAVALTISQGIIKTLAISKMKS